VRAASRRSSTSPWPSACSFSRSHCALHAADPLAQVGQLALDLLAALDGGRSFSTARCSISSCVTRRSTSSISVGSELFSIDTREAASSTRSIALSGRKRSAM
jgi:hypothetical protein